MTASVQPSAEPVIIYSDSDGQPMADNTKQFRCLVTIQGGLDALFKDNADIFVAGDLLWYPVEGDNKTRLAPDVKEIAQAKVERLTEKLREMGVNPDEI